MERITRRALIVGGAAAGAAAVGGAWKLRSEDHADTAQRVPGGARSRMQESSTTTAPDPARWIVEENAKPGVTGWQVPDGVPKTWDAIRGYATTTSVNRDSEVSLRVSTAAPQWKVQALRIGWYGGMGARLVWESDPVRGEQQDPPVLDAAVGTWTAPWRTNLTFSTKGWPPGMYLLKLVGSDGGMSYVPMVVRDDANRAALLVQSSVTTWQAYNEWGGKSLYTDNGSSGGRPGNAGRASVVTFDRPYYRNGSGEFFGREDGVVMFLEKHGYDVTYWTDIDLHANPDRVKEHRALLSLGHDEYYSTPMRRGLEAARDAGTNLVFLGANAIFRKIRLEPSDTGPFRHEVNYRSTKDPVFRTDPSETTVSWRQSPVNEPESALIGNYYESNPVQADMVVVNTDNWFLDGTGLRPGDKLPGLVANEYDRVTPEAPTPTDIEVFCHSPVVCRGKHSFADVTWYSHQSGAGVFAVGTFEWVKRLNADVDGHTPSAADPPAAIQAATKNLMDAVSAGPAGRAHPARRNLEQLGIHPGYVKDPPPT